MTETGCCTAASENEACGEHEKWSSNKVRGEPTTSPQRLSVPITYIQPRILPLKGTPESAK